MIELLGNQATAAAKKLRGVSATAKNRALHNAAAEIRRNADALRKANQTDIEEAVSRGLSDAMQGPLAPRRTTN